MDAPSAEGDDSRVKYEDDPADTLADPALASLEAAARAASRAPIAPSPQAQATATAKAMAGVTPEAVGAVLAKCTPPMKLARADGAGCIDSRKGLGVINPIYFVRVRASDDESDEDAGARHVVLRIGNVHPCWQRVKTAGEVALLQFVAEETSIPVPAVLGWCDDATESPLQCEYIVFERVRGVPMGELQKTTTVTAKQLESYVTQLAGFVAELRDAGAALSASRLRFGGFGANRLPTATIGDCPFAGPFATWSAQMRYMSRWGAEHLESEPFHEPHRHLGAALRRFADAELAKYDEEFPDDGGAEVALCHRDLNPGNVLVEIDPDDADRLIVTAVLDWEKAGFSFLDEDVETLQHVGITNEWCKLRRRLQAETGKSNVDELLPDKVDGLPSEAECASLIAAATADSRGGPVTMPPAWKARKAIERVVWASVFASFYVSTWFTKGGELPMLMVLGGLAYEVDDLANELHRHGQLNAADAEAVKAYVAHEWRDAAKAATESTGARKADGGAGGDAGVLAEAG